MSGGGVPWVLRRLGDYSKVVCVLTRAQTPLCMESSEPLITRSKHQQLVAVRQLGILCIIRGSWQQLPEGVKDDADTGALPAAPPPSRTRVSLRWGGLWFDGIVTATKRGLDANGCDAIVSHVLYSAAHGFRPSL